MRPTFGELLHKLLVKHSITPSMLGYGRRTIDSWYAGTRIPSPTSLHDVVTALIRSEAQAGDVRELVKLWFEIVGERKRGLLPWFEVHELEGAGDIPLSKSEAESHE